ncbi:MAG: hypothetical protein RBS07_00275 [Lentimicrobium sp.]|jgi:hypothetical protein|nr:hypothetical protein [Lentimicrobium sp.]
MKWWTGILTLLLIAFMACNKDEFPDEFSIIGSWIEQSTDTNKIEIEFKSSNRVYLNFQDGQPIDTLRYKLEKKDELQLFLPEDYPNGIRSTHSISYSTRTEELIIYSLLPAIPESPSRTVFKRK